MVKYEKQEAILKQRNSYSKTDPDATFMGMKDDHMQNGQLKPAYNIQASTNNQYLTNYTLAQTTENYKEFTKNKKIFKERPEKEF